MITNERQYEVTKREMRKFEEAIATLIERGVEQDTDDALFRRLQVDAMRSQVADLRAELHAYEAQTARTVASAAGLG
jgi:hypothetical protein